MAALYGSLVDGLESKFTRIDVVTALPHYGQRSTRGRRHSEWITENVRVVRCRPPSWRFRTFLPARFLWETSFAVRNTLVALWLSRDWDVVLSSTPPLLLGLGSAVISRLRKIPLVWWVQDLHPEIALALRLTSSESLSFRILHLVHDRILRQARLVVAISKAQRQALIDAYPSLGADRVVVVENPAAHTPPTNLEDPPSSEPLIVAFTGNLGLSQGLQHVLDVAEMAHNLPIRFILHGAGAAELALKKAARERRIDNVEFSPFTTDECYFDLLKRTHVLLLTLLPGIDRYSFPSKLWTYLAAGRPILGWVGSGGAVQEVLELSGAGVFAPWGDVQASVDSLIELLDKERRSELATAARAFYRSHLTPEGHAKAIAELLTSL